MRFEWTVGKFQIFERSELKDDFKQEFFKKLCSYPGKSWRLILPNVISSERRFFDFTSRDQKNGVYMKFFSPARATEHLFH